MSTIEISKMNAAERQINCAVKMFFNSEDPVAIHTLVGAAVSLFYDLNSDVSAESSWEAKISKDNRILKKDFLKEVREAVNFFKHADKDPNRTIFFNTKDTENLMFVSSLNYGNLLSRKNLLSIELSVFQIWYIAAHQNIKKFDSRLIAQANEVFPQLYDLKKDKQLQKGIEFLIKMTSKGYFD